MLFRFPLAIPALIVASTLGGVVLVIAILGWWYALVKARMPDGMRNLGVACLRYTAQADAYLLLLTDRYPYAAPVLRDADAELEEIAAVPTPAVGDAF